MAVIDELKQLPPVAEKPSWVKDLIAQRYQPKTERLKRTPQGFDFKREPFDPSSYYKQLGLNRDISRAATTVTQQEAINKENSERQKAAEADKAAMMKALQGVNASFTYGATGNTGGSRKYGLKGVTATTSKAADYFGSKYGIKTIGGLGPGSVPGSDHPKGKATDFMINNIKNGTAVGTALANDIIKNYKAWDVKYVIWNRYIWQPGRGWTKYSGPSAHTDHVHVSYNH